MINYFKALSELTSTITDSQIAVRFAADCAQRVLPIWERRYSYDRRPRYAIETARRYVADRASLADLQTAAQAAWTAANVPLREQSRAAWAAADAAWAAAEATADITRPILAATRAANNALAASDAWAVELDWQTNRLAELLRLQETP